MSRPAAIHEGVLEIHDKGYGFLRTAKKNYVAQPSDPYVPVPLIQKHKLREGLLIAGPIQPGHRGDGVRLSGVDTIEGKPAKDYRQPSSEDLTPIDPNQRLRLETGAE